QDIINYAAIEKDVLIVAAGGNTDDDVFFFPASYDNVLSVAALNENDEKASFSTYNSNIDIAAPGVGIYSTVNGDGYGIDNGSSYASPLVAGVGALVRGQYPELTALEVAERIKLSADPIYDLPGNKGYTGKLGTGRLNAFRALTQQKFTQLNVTVDSIFQTNGELFFEDTVSIYLTIQNQESAVFLLEASLGSSSDYVIPIDSSYTIGYLENGSKIANGPFSFRLAKNTPASTPLSVFIKLTDENRHESYHVIDFETSSNHQTLSNDSISLTIVDDGNLGYKPDGYFDGQGFKYQSNLTQDIGFFIHFNDSTLYDNLPYVISSGKVENDFVSKEILKPYSNADAKAYYFSVFEDSASNLLIESYAVLWDSLPGSALGISYRISNQSEDTLLNLRSGIFVDFDTQATAASSGSVYADSIAIIFDSLQVHQGIHLAADNSFFSLIDVSSLSDTLQKSDKQNLILSTQDSVGFDSVVNAAMIGGAYFPSLNPNSSQEFQLVLGAGDSLEHILQQLKLAAYRLTAFKEEPLIDSLIFACVEGAYDLVPEKGFDFYFFSDPLGADTLAFNDSIRIKNITSDSIIYLSKINTKGVSETIKGIQIKLFDNIADFRFPSDTIFLGDHPQNRVEITDLSVDPISWSWDFGGGSIATGIQNPSPIFADTGRFDVTLTIENIQGCSDQKTKSLTVLERPSPPELSIIGFCPGDSILIELTDTILMYPFESSLQAFFVGNSFHSAPLTSDTVLFISRKVNGIESKKAKVLLTENPTALDLKITSNLDSLQGFWASFIFEQEFISTVLWNLDTMSSFENPVDFPLLSDSLVLHYEVITDSSCVVVGDSTLQLTSSSAPTIPSFEVCNGEDVVISPEDGNAFGFYLDSLLSQPLHKGTSYRIDSLTSKITLFVVGLDSLLPSAPVPVEISPIDYQFEILSSQDSIYLNLNRSISFEVSEESERVIWYIDSVQQAITLTPTLFFTTPGVYQIVAEGWHAAGCTYTDSMLVSVLEEYIEPLNLDPQGETLLFPTPSSDYLLYEHQLKIKSIQAYDLTGKQHTVSFDLNKVDLTPLPQGLFFLEIETQNGLIISFKGIKSTKK
ncbi:MAG: S8 family serine peptidase, partial [Cyclobacteriaceae bacterium]